MKTTKKLLQSALLFILGMVCVYSATGAVFLSTSWNLETAWMRIQALSVVVCIIFGAFDIAETISSKIKDMWREEE